MEVHLLLREEGFALCEPAKEGTGEAIYVAGILVVHSLSSLVAAAQINGSRTRGEMHTNDEI